MGLEEYSDIDLEIELLHRKRPQDLESNRGYFFMYDSKNDCFVVVQKELWNQEKSIDPFDSAFLLSCFDTCYRHDIAHFQYKPNGRDKPCGSADEAKEILKKLGLEETFYPIEK